jgi:hypothetical protein
MGRVVFLQGIEFWMEGSEEGKLVRKNGQFILKEMTTDEGCTAKDEIVF